MLTERGHIEFGPAPSTGTVFLHWLAQSCYATRYVWTCRGMYQKRVALVLQTMSQNVLMQLLEEKIHMHSCKCTWFMFVLYFFEGLYIWVCLWDSEDGQEGGLRRYEGMTCSLRPQVGGNMPCGCKKAYCYTVSKIAFAEPPRHKQNIFFDTM